MDKMEPTVNGTDTNQHLTPENCLSDIDRDVFKENDIIRIQDIPAMTQSLEDRVLNRCTESMNIDAIHYQPTLEISDQRPFYFVTDNSTNYIITGTGQELMHSRGLAETTITGQTTFPGIEIANLSPIADLEGAPQNENSTEAISADFNMTPKKAIAMNTAKPMLTKTTENVATVDMLSAFDVDFLRLYCTEDSCSKGLNLFKCGGCASIFDTMCKLHFHLQSHAEGGSYHYDHISKTAFPKCGSSCAQTQTDTLSCYSNKTVMDHDITEADLPSKSQLVPVNEIDAVFNMETNSVNKTEAPIARTDDMEAKTQDASASDGNVETSQAVNLMENPVPDDCVSVSLDVRGSAPVPSLSLSLCVDGVNTNKAIAVVDTVSSLCFNDMRHRSTATLIKESNSNVLDPFWNESTDRKSRRSRSKAKKKRVIFNDSDTNIGTKLIDCNKQVEANTRNTKSTMTEENDKDESFSICTDTDTLEDTSRANLSKLEGTNVVCGLQNLKAKISEGQMAQATPNDIKSKECFKDMGEDEKTLCCEYCGVNFSSKSDVLKHFEEVHESQKRYKGSQTGKRVCVPCNKVYATEAGLQCHKISKHSGKVFICDICDTKLCSASSLKQHQIEQHFVKITGHYCESCKRQFSQACQLREHMKTVHGQFRNQTYICEICGYQTDLQSTLSYHKRRYHRGKVFKCDYCDFSTTSSGPMSRHRKMHLGKRDYVCHYCGQTFLDKGTLVKHIRIHTGERPYQCKQCPKAFATITPYERHMKMHSNTRNYTCDFCDKTFVQKTNCIAHMRQHTGEKPYKCDVCGIGFAHNVSRKNHMVKQHRMQIDSKRVTATAELTV